MKRTTAGTFALISVLVLATVANAAYNMRASSPRKSALSDFTVGDELPSLDLAPLTHSAVPAAQTPLPNGCRIVVLFSATCPHCHTAARRDALVADSLRLPTVWVSHTDDEDAAGFGEALTTGAYIRYGGPTAFEQMKVKGVPAAFLVSHDGVVRWVGGYNGGVENHRIMRSYC